MKHLFHTPIPMPWLLMDILTLLITLVVVLVVVRKSRHPTAILLECFSFVFLYASIFENFAVVNQWYVYGRSFLMIGDVPLSVPLIEMDVLVVGLWLLKKMDIPNWCKPFVMGLLGMLQDLSLDPVAVRQVFTTQGVATGRWTWLLQPGMVNIYDIPVYNFPGWMLIMMYAAVYILIGRWWFKRSGYKPLVGYVYPLAALVLALATMVSPLSQVLLWLAPFFTKGSSAEWVMFGFHLAFPTALLIVLWKGKMKHPLTFQGDLPIWAVTVLFHLADILGAILGGYNEVIWLVVLSSLAHVALLVLVYLTSQKMSRPVSEPFVLGP